MARVRALIDGRWHAELAPTDPHAKRLRTRPSIYRDWITPDGSPGPTGRRAYPAEPGRYHLYVSYACPWAHRTILYRSLKGLQNIVTMSVLHPRMASEHSWTFDDDSPLATPDHLYHSDHLHQVYTRGDPSATTVVTVPMLWDRKRETIVNRESCDIIRMLESGFDAWGDSSVHFRPADLAEDIERMNAFVLRRICAAVYRAGFAADQSIYDREVAELFRALDALEIRLARQPWLLGDRITEADWHLFCTLVRFDAAYHGALRCNLRRLIEYPALAAHTRRLYEQPGVAETVDFEAIRLHYFDDHPEVDRRIVPAGPVEDFRGNDIRSHGGVMATGMIDGPA